MGNAIIPVLFYSTMISAVMFLPFILLSQFKPFIFTGDFMQQLFNEKKESYFDAQMKASLGEFYPMLGTMQWMMQNRRIDQCIYARVPFEVVIW